jgi:NodT family efflux transporter outer membrane factor (OMF) lipoprotein
MDIRRFALALLPLALTACAVTSPPASVPVAAPDSWQAAADQPKPPGTDLTAPHSGSAAQLKAWWQQWNDPLLIELLDRAQQASPSVAAAATRVAQARQAVVVAGAAGSPSLNASAGVSRGVSMLNTPPATSASVGLQAAWELDLFGGQRAASTAADQRLQAAGAQWHEARVAVAAELARQYTGWRACELALRITQDDAQARTTIAKLTDDRARAGFEAPANASLTQASAAQGRMNTLQQQARCDAALKGLVALTGVDESTLRVQLMGKANVANKSTQTSGKANFGYEIQPLPLLPPNALPVALPAQLLEQRPDVFAAQRAVAAASADVGTAEADRYPRLGLSGNIMAIGTRGVGGDGNTWSVGPLQLSLPLFDAGRRAGQVKVQQAAYDEAVVAYRASVRTAVREVEQALVELNSTAARQADAAVATQGFVRALQAATDRHRAGLGSLLELEDTRRSALAAELALAELSRDRLLAWVDLYRALGGGWSRVDAASTSAPITATALPR